MIHSVRKVSLPQTGKSRRKLFPTMLLLGGMMFGSSANLLMAQEGLRGILPAELPERLGDAVGSLKDNWQQWSDETINVLVKLYSADPLDVAGQTQLLDDLDKRIATTEKAINDPAYAAIHDDLVTVQGALSRRVALYRAILGTSGSDAAALRGHLTTLVNNVEGYEQNGTQANAKGLREAFSGIRSSSADNGAAISDALRANYLNYNTRIAATEGFVHRMLTEERAESGEVRDFILCADVYGNQVTCTTSGIDFLPQDGGIRFNITLNGVVNSSTDGYAAKAVVHTEGVHTFTAYKEVAFDGTNFTTQPGTINVVADNTPTKARTKFSGVPFLGSIADDTALQRAVDLEPESEAIAQERVSSRVLPRFDEEVNKRFADASANFQTKVVTPLKELNQYPDVIHYQTTDQHLISASRVMTVGELGGGTPHPSLISNVGMTVLLHESVINNSIDRLEIAGKTMTEPELRKLIEDRMSKLLDREIKSDKPASTDADQEGPKALIFASEDPLRIRVQNGQIVLVFRAGFKREGKDDIAPQIVTIPMNMQIVGDKLSITRGDISIAALDKNANVAEQIALAGVVRKKFESSITPREVDRETTLKKANDQEVKATLTSVKAVDGWLALTFE